MRYLIWSLAFPVATLVHLLRFSISVVLTFVVTTLYLPTFIMEQVDEALDSES